MRAHALQLLQLGGQRLPRDPQRLLHILLGKHTQKIGGVTQPLSSVLQGSGATPRATGSCDHAISEATYYLYATALRLTSSLLNAECNCNCTWTPCSAAENDEFRERTWCCTRMPSAALSCIRSVCRSCSPPLQRESTAVMLLRGCSGEHIVSHPCSCPTGLPLNTTGQVPHPRATTAAAISVAHDTACCRGSHRTAVGLIFRWLNVGDKTGEQQGSRRARSGGVQLRRCIRHAPLGLQHIFRAGVLQPRHLRRDGRRLLLRGAWSHPVVTTRCKPLATLPHSRHALRVCCTLCATAAAGSVVDDGHVLKPVECAPRPTLHNVRLKVPHGKRRPQAM